MSVSGIISEEVDKQAALASVAFQNASDLDVGLGARQLLPRTVLDMLGPYSAALYIAERVDS